MSDNEDGSARMTAEEMDEKRSENIAYQYLCRLEESKKWIEACIGEEIAATVELEEHLRNGVTLAKLGHFISPSKVSLKKIYDFDLSRYESRGLHFRHTDNINHFLLSLKDISFPEIFYPETTDVYDRKNVPRLIYCIHALSLYMFKIGRAPQILDLYGKIQFTDEEISNMKRELDKYGISMPSFSKIGGILANEMPVDEAELHAAVIAINQAIDLDQPEHTYQALCNPSAHLMNMNEAYADDYQAQLLEAKNSKADSARNRSLQMEQVADAYDELLTQAELQGNISHVNLCYSVAAVNERLLRGDGQGLMGALRGAAVVGVDASCVDAYLRVMAALISEKKGKHLNIVELQKAVNMANQLCHKQRIEEAAVKKINQSLKADNAKVTFAELENADLGLPEVKGHARELYHGELQVMRQEKEVDLSFEDITRALLILNSIVEINTQIDSAHLTRFHDALRNPHAHLNDLDDLNDEKYIEELKKSKLRKTNERNNLLTYMEIQRTIAYVNNDVIKHHELVRAVEAINEALLNDDAHVTYETLVREAGVVENVQEAAGLHYHDVMKESLLCKREETGDEEGVLWMDEIQTSVNQANADAREAENLSARVAAINLAVENEDEEEMGAFLTDLPAKVKASKGLVPAYLACMQTHKRNKMAAHAPSNVGSGWMHNTLKGGSKYYFNVHSLQGSWREEEGYVEDGSILTKEDIETCLQTVNQSSPLNWLFKSREPYVIKLQAHAKGWLLRRHLATRRKLFADNLFSVMIIQRWWRRVLQRLQLHRRMQYYRENCAAVVHAQSLVRRHLTHKRYHDRLHFFKQNEDSVVKIQSFVRSALAKKDYQTLMHGDTPSVPMIRKFLHLLDVTEKDYAEQIELDNLKQRLVRDIRRNQNLDQVLSEMDVKIGLLVKNRISLQDLITQNNKFLNTNSTNNANNRHSMPTTTSSTTTTTTTTHGGLKALSKASHDKLQAYQHLFYLLQTQPHYLAKLIFLLPQSKTTRFMESAILSIFNYAANHRDDFMLLGLFKTALQEEITSRITSPSDISTGNPMVVKLIVSFNRTPRGQNVLRELLGGLVGEVLANKDLCINTNVVDVYKQWLNALEAATGKPSGMPYEVTVEQALAHEEVSKRIGHTIATLQQAAHHFLTSILQNIHMIPYGMRYMAKVMKSTLHERFPETAEKEIIKIIGNFIYYRYINSAIVAPDAFDIIDVGASNGLTNEQRRNLGSIAKILQFSASNKGFGSDSPHLIGMNKYISEAHASFKAYFLEVCNVEEPEVVFNIDQYSDISRITKPVICISAGEMVDMHRLLVEHARTIAPSSADALHELLADLGAVLPVEALLGESSAEDKRERLAKTEITLTLSSKHELLEGAGDGLDGLWVRTKQMIVDILRCQKSGDNLSCILNTRATSHEESVHRALVKERDRQESKADVSKVSRQMSLRGVQDCSGMSLEEMKVVVRGNLEQLQEGAYMAEGEDYQSVFDSILKDFRNLRLQRQLRRKELKRLQATLSNLLAKKHFFEEQINYYNQYVRSCLDKQAAKAKKKIVVKYTASRLHEKGVLLDIEGLKSNQFKNVLFDIASTDAAGLFIINAKFMGVNMEKLQLNFQDLLELQYEGQAIMRLFDRAQVNVNLLIHLLNKKFYGLK